ncbi:ThiF family adenylyltransferase [Synechococcus sp. CBW1006]|uniref:HesA/MoeB/ThiF family protein n=1 Tax=Synechococcus sp. CBW1006 TaxID=1353138 RepID=UPI0018CF12F0|nr:ThiF family adenylyltransferase [Synechococcus sp. CBW1006]QPN66526.1 ThiF family adenylyltransferase [Synechococcus sp. CBW1006]
MPDRPSPPQSHVRTTVLFPADLAGWPDGSPLYGYAHPDTGQTLVLDSCGNQPPRHQPRAVLLGWLEPQATGNDELAAADAPSLVVRRDGELLRFWLDGQPCQAQPYDLESALFSRHTCLLEERRLQDAGVIICGCGSVGGLAALELARSGVGRFLLIDPDLLSLENLCRHPCGLADVGRRKVDATAERIHQINPNAVVQVQATTIERLDPAVVQAFASGAEPSGEAQCAEAARQGGPITLMLACADSRRADRHAARLAAALELPFLAIGLWERAFAGEIFYSHPAEPMPCYGCAFEELSQGGQGNHGTGEMGGEERQSLQALSGKQESQRRFYATEAALEKLDFQPGLGIDIAYVTQIGLKLALDLLNLHTPSYAPRLLGKLSQFTLVCNSNDPRLGGERAEIFSHPLQVTTSIQVGYGQGCPPCRWRD